MKKLKFNQYELLSRSQLKSIFGGGGEMQMSLDGTQGGSGNCTVRCKDGRRHENQPDCSRATAEAVCGGTDTANGCVC
ncbi:hypothetical protein [Ascidiimonas sp. W6]|uniref:hypothetical protein n=1 Tax=Ascidiimonas meishanensis TaxID=3128903 RepID=UPI0030EC9C60